MLTGEDILNSLDPTEGMLARFNHVAGLSHDRVSNAIDDAKRECMPHKTEKLLPVWEELYELVPGDTDPLEIRRNRLLAKYLARGGMSIPYFTALAAAMGYTITITEYLPRRFGDPFGEPYRGEDWYWRWLVTIWTDTAVPFRMRQFGDPFGEPYTYYTEGQDLIDLIQELRPAWTTVSFEFQTP